MAKYHNVKTRGYDSVREAERARVLHLLEKAGKIRDLCEQVKYELIPAQYEGKATGDADCHGRKRPRNDRNDPIRLHDTTRYQKNQGGLRHEAL